ncbi:MAG: alpha/beta fold hydrolase [Saccharospirillaceae bacterium]|nr:alpha/beta hydrolase [Pseudomonadales bacterium]NRB79103.1 alpha/beta fold hydrolase [Saccharospirillaceae bacterium]
MKTSQLFLSIMIVLLIAVAPFSHAIDSSILAPSSIASSKITPSITKLANCEAKNATCYRAELPETKQSHQMVSIDIQYWQATGERLNPYPIVWLMGGPGRSNLNPPMPDWVWEHFDVLAVGYRGIDGSPRLDCPKLRQQFKFESKNRDDDFLSTITLARLSQKVESCQQNWGNKGINTQAYGIYEVVEDIDQVRKMLGFDKINLLSVSYGTRIAWYFDQLKPGVVDRSLIMSGNPDGGFFFDPYYTQLQLLTLEGLCDQDDYCQSKLPNLSQTIKSVLTNLPDKAWGVFLDADQIRLVTFMMLYSKDSIPMVIDAYSKASQGNYSGLVAMQKYPNPFAKKDWVWGTFLSAGSIDLTQRTTFELTLEQTASTTVLNSPLSELLYGGITKGWKSREYQPLQNHNTNTPTLIFGSDIDLATPIERIQKLWMPFIKNGSLLNVVGAGHAPDHMFAGGPQLEKHMLNFLQTGTHTTQQTFGTAFDFKAKFSLSLIIYAFWGVIGLLISALIIVIALVL